MTLGYCEQRRLERRLLAWKREAALSTYGFQAAAPLAVRVLMNKLGLDGRSIAMAESIESLIARLEDGADDQGRGVIAEAVWELRALAKDAARYRWLRDTPWPQRVESVVRCHSNRIWDETIDAAIREAEGGGSA